jgi:hypothetical protein
MLNYLTSIAPSCLHRVSFRRLLGTRLDWWNASQTVQGCKLRFFILFLKFFLGKNYFIFINIIWMGNHHVSYPTYLTNKEARVCVAYMTRLYNKTKSAQYVQIIEEDDKPRVKLL